MAGVEGEGKGKKRAREVRDEGAREVRDEMARKAREGRYGLPSLRAGSHLRAQERVAKSEFKSEAILSGVARK